MPRGRRLSFGLLALLGSLLCGCIPYVFPSLVITRPLDVSEVAEEVRAFRVDISAKHGAPCYGEEQFSLSELLLVAGMVPPQVKPTVDSGVIIIGVALNYHFHYHDGVHVRLYRRGYELAQFKSWQFGKRLEWTPVKDCAGRERTIDTLLAGPGTVAWCQFTPKKDENQPWTLHGGLRPGAYSKAHREALAFAAREYERLADALDCPVDARARLQDKAAQVRAHADK
jgi:hypothetical protein